MNRGFTLIEVMISVGLGSLIIMVAVSGMRVTAQAFTAANRMSNQNAMLRTAIVAANENMDFWDSFDPRSGPPPPLATSLRTVGRPFYKLDFTTPITHLDFTHKNISQWSNLPAWDRNISVLGNYSTFGNQKIGNQLLATPDPDNLVPNERQWRHNILTHLTNNLGYYAAIDYLPANFVFGYYDSNGALPPEFGQGGSGPGRFRTPHMTGGSALSKVEIAHGSGYVLTNVGHQYGHPSCHKVVYERSSGWAEEYVKEGTQGWSIASPVDFLPPTSVGQPMHWPQVTIKTRVTMWYQNFNHESQITMVDPYTGETAIIRMKSLTTTLRGARRQRGCDVEKLNVDGSRFRWEP